MAFADPQSISISGSANPLPRTGSSNNESTYRKDDGNLTLEIRHSYGKRNRSLVKVTHRKVAPDPMVGAQNLQYSMSVNIVIDRPPVGYTPAEVKAVVDGLIANLNASSGANMTKFIGGES